MENISELTSDVAAKLHEEQESVKRQRTIIGFWIWANVIMSAINASGAAYWWFLR